MLLHHLSWIPIIMKGFTPVSCLVLEVCLSKLKNNHNYHINFGKSLPESRSNRAILTISGVHAFFIHKSKVGFNN